jgi:hypothetical protein
MELTTIRKVCPHCLQDAVVVVTTNDFNRWVNGELAQRAFPEMKPEDREMLISGVHPKCWEELYPEEE